MLIDSNNTDDHDNTIVVSPSINSVVTTKITLTTSAIEIKVGASRLSERRYLIIEALDNNIKFGFDLNCEYTIFKNQFLMLPIGDVAIYAKTSTGTGNLVITEGSIY